jgi:hypothetical protein
MIEAMKRLWFNGEGLWFNLEMDEHLSSVMYLKQPRNYISEIMSVPKERK